MSQRVNHWTRWHPGSPIFKTESAEDLEWLISLKENSKLFTTDITTKKGDRVHQRLRRIRIAITKFICTECNAIETTRGVLAAHIMKEHHFGMKVALKKAMSANETQISRTLGNVDLYYEVVRPRRALKLPRSVEVDISTFIPKGTKMPTPQERELHDRQMRKWRKDMMTLPRADHLERLPNGIFSDPGLSGNWWYYVPHVWRQEARQGEGAWLEPTDQECVNWSTLKLPKRVLFLLCIVEDK